MGIKFQKLAVAATVFSTALAGVEVQAASLTSTDVLSGVNCSSGCSLVQSTLFGNINELGSYATVGSSNVAVGATGMTPGSLSGPFFGTASAELTYAIMFSGAAGSIQVEVGASGGLQPDNNAQLYSGGYGTATLSIFGSAPTVATNFTTQEAAFNRPDLYGVSQVFGIDQKYTFAANQVYYVDLYADAFTSTGYVAAYVDPFFVAPDGYSIILGPGVTNSPPGGVSATPLPAALPLFSSGLAAAGLIGWRRKRKASLAPT